MTEVTDFMKNPYTEREGKLKQFWQVTHHILDENFILNER